MFLLRELERSKQAAGIPSVHLVSARIQAASGQPLAQLDVVAVRIADLARAYAWRLIGPHAGSMPFDEQCQRLVHVLDFHAIMR